MQLLHWNFNFSISGIQSYKPTLKRQSPLVTSFFQHVREHVHSQQQQPASESESRRPPGCRETAKLGCCCWFADVAIVDVFSFFVDEENSTCTSSASSPENGLLWLLEMDPARAVVLDECRSMSCMSSSNGLAIQNLICLFDVIVRYLLNLMFLLLFFVNDVTVPLLFFLPNFNWFWYQYFWCCTLLSIYVGFDVSVVDIVVFDEFNVIQISLWNSCRRLMAIRSLLVEW